MHKIDTPTSVNGAFVDKDISHGIPGTTVDASWLNAVQNELCNVITEAGLTLSKTNDGQLLLATKILINKVCKKTILPSLNYSGNVGNTLIALGDAESFDYGAGNWIISGSIFVDVSSSASNAKLTMYIVVDGISRYSMDIDASSVHNETLMFNITIPFASGSFQFKINSTNGPVTATVNVSGFRSQI